MSDKEYIDAENAVIDARRAYLQANLYLPEIFSKKIDQFIKDLDKLEFYCRRKYDLGLPAEYLDQAGKNRRELTDKLSSQFAEITVNMKKSLLDDNYDVEDDS